MRPEPRSRSNHPEKANPPKPRQPGDVPTLSGKKALGGSATPASGAHSLTALMSEYRSWWNLPQSKSKKNRP